MIGTGEAGSILMRMAPSEVKTAHSARQRGPSGQREGGEPKPKVFYKRVDIPHILQ